jgi:hypothetical protein
MFQNNGASTRQEAENRKMALSFENPIKTVRNVPAWYIRYRSGYTARVNRKSMISAASSHTKLRFAGLGGCKATKAHGGKSGLDPTA